MGGFKYINMKKYIPFNFKEESEEDKSIKAIGDLIDLNWGKDEDAQQTAVALFRALVLANTEAADKFIQDVSDFTSNMKKEDYK
jgi:hypothetical protein